MREPNAVVSLVAALPIVVGVSAFDEERSINKDDEPVVPFLGCGGLVVLGWLRRHRRLFGEKA
jgi:hypothetical protein